MTRKEIENDYETENGFIQSPGKFESEPIWAPYFYDIALNGFADDDDGKTWTFEISTDDMEQFPELTGIRQVRMSEDDNGFIHTYSVSAD